MPKPTGKPAQETSDVRLPLLGYLLAGYVALIAGVPFSLWFFYPSSRERLDVTRPVIASAQPKLQTDPAADLREYQDAQSKRLSRLEVNPGNPNTFQIPIDRAMELIAARGLQGWPHQ
jgi:hypothetical protein